jgi:hypothetical protein
MKISIYCRIEQSHQTASDSNGYEMHGPQMVKKDTLKIRGQLFVTEHRHPLDV